uniref:Uncharacterized protein n=1 Tax=Sphaerodactylus townsendi TaxID=933632 RepID=A0ACB8FT08_9SAUR
MEAERAVVAAARAGQASVPGEQPPQPPPLPQQTPPAPGRGELSLPGILHFIQHEWARFEAEKSRWEAEKAELQRIRDVIGNLLPDKCMEDINCFNSATVYLPDI